MAQTTAEILQAAEELAATGERVSVRSVRARLGGGDPGTIGRALKGYREAAAAHATATAQQPILPDALTRALVDWAGKLVTEQVKTVREELKATSDDNDTYLAQVDALEAKIAELESALAVAQRECAETAGARDAVQKQVETQATELAQERARAAELDQRLTNQTAQIQAAKETRQEIAAVRAENQALIERATAAETALKDAVTRAESAEKKVELAEQRIREAEQAAATARSEAAAATAKADAAERAAETAERTAAAAETRAETAQQHLFAALTQAQQERLAEESEAKATKKRQGKKKGQGQEPPQADEVESLPMFPEGKS